MECYSCSLEIDCDREHPGTSVKCQTSDPTGPDYGNSCMVSLAGETHLLNSLKCFIYASFFVYWIYMFVRYFDIYLKYPNWKKKLKRNGKGSASMIRHILLVVEMRKLGRISKPIYAYVIQICAMKKSIIFQK